TYEVSLTESLSLMGKGIPIHALCLESSQPLLKEADDQVSRWKLEADHVIETAEQGAIQDLRMVRGRDDDAKRVICFYELEEAVQHPADLPRLVRHGPLGTDSVEFIEEVDTPGLVHGLKDQLQLGGGLPHELRDQ